MVGTTVRYVVRFTGHVQGVGFRATTLASAHGLKVHGYVRNEADGSVRLDADGSEADLKELVRRVQSAMSGKVDDTIIDRQPTLNRVDGLHIQH